MNRTLILALLSGVPALVYEVVWTREVALLVGSQIEAISIVLVSFFAGLALGSRVLGGLSDRVDSPLRLYAALEAGAGGLAVLSHWVLRGLGEGPLAGASGFTQLALSAGLLFPVTFLLGGTLPALLRSGVGDGVRIPGAAGRIIGANTVGAVAGVAAAAVMVPWLGLRVTVSGAGLSAIGLGAAAFLLSRAERRTRHAREAAPGPSATGVPAFVLATAALAGTATLAYEVLATRAASLRLGSSLHAWALVLGLFLLGLAFGNLALARRAGRSRDPAGDLGWIESAAALLLVLGATWGIPSVLAPATGLDGRALLEMTAWILPPTLLMGAALPFFVRLAVDDAGGVGAPFGAVIAANTVGGIAGSLLAPFVLLPALGLSGAVWVCAGLNLALGILFVLRSAAAPGARWLRAGLGAGLVALTAWVARSPETGDGVGRAIFVAHGRQATAAVVRVGGRRDLIVDGDAQASTAGSARKTEELLAVLPLLLHPEARRLLEVGLGSGITLATAARFPLERIDCVEISGAVLRAAPYFAPDNGPVSAGGDPRIRITQGDGRAYLARHPGEYDVIVANTVHPGSVGATGLYSREYFTRIAAALRPGGLAVQWLPVERLGAEPLASILRTFFAVFEEGGLWWGANNLIVIGSQTRVGALATEVGALGSAEIAATLEGMGIRSVDELMARRLASAESAREALGPGALLSDDRPTLEALGSRGRRGTRGGGELALVERIARIGAGSDAASGPLLLWLQSRVAREAGRTATADTLLRLAEDAGMALARDERIARLVARADADLSARRIDAGERGLRRAIDEDPHQRDARFGLAALSLERGDFESARTELAQLLDRHPRDAEGWNLLGVALSRSGSAIDASKAFERALQADPFLPEAMANAGLLAAEAGDAALALALLDRLRAISPLGATPEERALREALEQLGVD